MVLVADAVAFVPSCRPPFTPNPFFPAAAHSSMTNDACRGGDAFVRDAQGRAKSVIDGAAVETKIRYDASGLVTARWDAVNGWTKYFHDSAGRLSDTTYSDGTHATLGYDAAGNVTTSCFGNVGQSFAYDMLNRLSVAIVRLGAVSWTNGWGRDLNGNVTAVTYPGGGSTVLGYDAENRLDALTNNLSGGGVFQFRYDPAGRLTGIKYPNGVESTNVWDLADRLIEQRAGKGAMTNIVRRTIRDDLGLPIRDEIDAGLMPVPTPDTWRRSVHDEGNRVLSATGMEGGVPASWAYTYDGAGNLLVAERTTTAGVSNVRYAYDCANRAVAVTSGASVVSHVYDATGCRVAKTESGVTRYYALDYSDPFKRPLAELTDAGALVRRYIWAGSLLLAMVESNGVVRYVHSDGRGSVIALTDASGNVTDQWAWGPYGEPWGRIGTNDLSFTWLGGSGVRSLGNGLYATYHRLYDANLRRFLQADPMGIGGGANVYAYGNLNPVVFVDPLGLCGRVWETGSYLGDVGEVFKGYGDSIAGIAQGMWQLASHPIQSVQGIGHAAINPGQTWRAISADYADRASSYRGRGSIVGEALTTLATLGAGAAANGGARAGQVARVVNAIDAVLPDEYADDLARLSAAETTLYRAVGPAELADIHANNVLRNLGSAEGKYFTTSADAAASYARQAVHGLGDPPYTLIQTRVPNSILEGLIPASVDVGGIPAWVVPNDRLRGLVPHVLPTMPIP